MGKNYTDQALLINNKTYCDIYDRFMMLARTIFKWKNLDKVCGFGANRFLESALFEFGKAVFVKDDKIGLHVFYANPSDQLNTYNLPIKVMAWSNGEGYNKMYDLDDVVLIMNNNLMKPTSRTIEEFSSRLYNIQRTADINLNALKTPLIIEGKKETMLTLKNIFMKYDGNVPVIYANKNFDVSTKLNVIDTKAPVLLKDLEDYKHEITNDLMTYLGINNANTSKRERLITSEVESNDDLINYFLNCFYETRKEACDLINEKFLSDSDTKIELELNEDVLNLLAETKLMLESEEDNNGEIYNNNKNING